MARRGGVVALAGALALASAPAWAQSPPSPGPVPLRSPAVAGDAGASGALADPGASSDLELRIARYQDHRLIYEPKPSAPYSLRQGPDEIFESDLVALLDDEDLTRHWSWLRARDWGLWLGAGAVGIPVGGLLFANNFVGQGPLAFFSVASQSAMANVSDPRSFALSAVGLAVAGGGLYFTGLWAAEVLDRHHPTRLDDPAVKLRVNAFNDNLRERLDLVYESLPPPPTPKPSTAPSPSPSVDPFSQPLWAPPTPAPGSTVDYPQPLPEAMPQPLPLLEGPAVVASPSPRAWVRPLWFPLFNPTLSPEAPASAPLPLLDGPASPSLMPAGPASGAPNASPASPRPAASSAPTRPASSPRPAASSRPANPSPRRSSPPSP